jgi:SAM-dependent methyltransferase
MCYGNPDARSLRSVLGVSLEEALDGFRAKLISEMAEACTSFMRTRADFGVPAQRHQSKDGLVYCSIELPTLTVHPDQAQRNSTRRFEQFGIGARDFVGLSVLDLGCNIGAMSFGAQVRGAAQVLGIEFDDAKVEIATRIARFSGLANTRFRQGNVDQLSAEDLGGLSDVVFCFAIDEHVDNPKHLFQLLGDVTGQTLYFEGNAGSDALAVGHRLRAVGFRSIEQLGVSDDERIAANNCRPLIVARR